MTRFLQILLGLGMLGIVILVFAFQNGILIEDRRDAWENADRYGYGVFSTFLSQGGSPLEPSNLGMSLSAGRGGLLINAELSQEEEERVLEQVRDGGIMIIIGDQYPNSQAAKASGLPLEWRQQPSKRTQKVLLEGNNRLVFEGAPLLLGNALEQNDNMTPILWVDGHVYGARVSVGEGSLYILSTPELVKNTAFKELEKAKFLSGILPLFHPPRWSAKIEFFTSSSPVDQPFRLFFLPQWIPFTLQIILAFILLAVLSFVRFGPPRVRWQPNRKILAHHLKAVGQLWSTGLGIAIADDIHQKHFDTKLKKIRPDLLEYPRHSFGEEFNLSGLRNLRDFFDNKVPQNRTVLADYCQIRNRILNCLRADKKGA